MNCDKIKPLLVGYLDGELDDEQIRRVEEHIAVCKECSAELDEMKRVRKILRKMSEPTMPDVFWQQYWNGIYNRLERQIGWIIFSIGMIVLLSFAVYYLIEDFFLDPKISLLLKSGIGAVILGAIILLVSVFREKMFAIKHERYREVDR